MIDRPDCAGYHQADPECDGNEEAMSKEDRTPCAYKDRCLSLIQLAGGKSAGNPDRDFMVRIEDVKRRYSETQLTRWMKRREKEEGLEEQLKEEADGNDEKEDQDSATGDEGKDDHVKKPKAKGSEKSKEASEGKRSSDRKAEKRVSKTSDRRSGKSRTTRASKKTSARKSKGDDDTVESGRRARTSETTARRSSTKGKTESRSRKRRGKKTGPKPRRFAGKPDDFLHVIPVLDAVASRIAKELGRIQKTEDDVTLAPGDLFIRYLPGMKGRKAGLYECHPRKKVDNRLLFRVSMHRRTASMHVETNCTNYTAAVALKPPAGAKVVQWKNVKDLVVLLGVDASTARDTGLWVARLYNAGLIEGDKVEAKKRASESGRSKTSGRRGRSLGATG